MAFRLAAGNEEEESTATSGPKLVVKGLSIDALADDLKIADQLTAYLNILAEVQLEESDEDRVEIGKKESRRSVLSQAVHDGLVRKMKVIVERAGGEAMPAATDAKAMRAYATRVLTRTKRG